MSDPEPKGSRELHGPPEGIIEGGELPSSSVDLLSDLMAITEQAHSVNHAVQSALERLTKEYHWPLGHYFVPRKDGTMEFAGGIWKLPGPGGEELMLASQAARYRPGDGWIGQVAAQGKPLWVHDLSGDEVDFDDPRLQLATARGLRGLFVHPVVMDLEVLAVIEIFTLWPFHPSENQLYALGQLSAQIGRMVARRRSDNELRRVQEKAETAIRVKGDFLAHVNHRVRTPMNAVIGMTEILLRTQLDPKQRELLKTVRAASDSMMTVVADVLDYLNLEWGALAPEHKPFGLRALIEDAFEALTPRAAEKELTLAYIVADAVPDVLVSDPVRLRTLLHQLLSNSVEFTPHGEVVLTVDVAEGGESGDGRRQQLEFAVRDTGIGIAPDRMDQLFEPFSQDELSMTQESGGTGLGLAVASRLCKLFGGELQAESELDRGSTFRFALEFETAGKEALPSLREAEGVRMNVAETAAVSTGPLTILVAEDNPVNQRVAMKMLEALDHEAELASNGRKALDALRRRRFDVVLMDVEMPELDGFEATRHIRQDWPPDEQPYIVAMTAKAMPGDRERCLEAGMDGYVSKPVTIASLRSALAASVTADSETMRDE